MPPITILVCALGGEGGGVLAEWLYLASVRAGHSAQSTSIPGVAQRTGATTYYIEVHPQNDALLAGRRPVFSLNPVPGAIDLLVSSELLETVRQVGAGMASRERTRIVSSTARALTVAEKMQLADGRADTAALLAALQRNGAQVNLLDFSSLAQQAGCAISAVLFGAIAASGALPLERAVFEETIRAAGRGVEASLRGFALAFDALAAQRHEPAGPPQGRIPEGEARRYRGERAAIEASVAAALAQAPEPVPAPDLRALGRARVLEYQDAAYARLYDERLARIDAAAAASRAGDPGTAVEAARWLALWMAFDDTVRVAALKLAASRQARVRREVAAQAGEIVKLYDHFKPGVPEFAALLPPALARRLRAWDRRRIAAGREPWALPLKLGTHTVIGALALKTLASMKGLRRHGSRYAQEQSLIERWLAAVERGAREHAALGFEIASCGRLVKGYGSTHERGQKNLLHIVDHLAFSAASAPERSEAVRAARIAALADDAGAAFAVELKARGAPGLPPREHSIRWYKRRPAV